MKLADVVMGFNLAGDLDKQLLLLSTAVLTISVTFLKDTGRAKWLLYFSWVALFLSIISGICLLGALTDQAVGIAQATLDVNVLKPVRGVAQAQEALFALGLLGS